MNPENQTQNANSTPQTHGNSSTPKVIGAVVALAAIAGVGAWALSDKNNAADTDTNTADNTSPEATPSENTTSPTDSGDGKYKDGTYKASGNYMSPAGTEEIELTLTLKDDKIASAQFTGKATNPGSVKMQGQFKDGYETMVVGKMIDAVSLSVVNGSSLTPTGFMEALQKIKAEAMVASS